MEEFGKELRANLIAVAVAAVAIYLVYEKLKKDVSVTIPAAIGDTFSAASDIIKSAPSFVASVVSGQNDSTYITREQQQALAVQRLAEKRAQQQIAMGDN